MIYRANKIEYIFIFLHTIIHSLPIMSEPIPGDFSFLDAHSCEMLTDAYKAITVAELWDLMKEDPGDGGYMFSQNPAYAKIDLQYTGHSGSSYGWTMRVMQFIAKNGWSSFYEEWYLRPKALETLDQTGKDLLALANGTGGSTNQKRMYLHHVYGSYSTDPVWKQRIYGEILLKDRYVLSRYIDGASC